MSFSYANPGSGPSAGGIGWFNFGNLTINPGGSLTGLTGTLNDGTTVTFDLSAPASSSMTFDAVSAPVSGYFGYTGYTGILGNVLLQNRRIGSYDPSTLKISNIVVKDPNGNPVTNYTTVVSDAENTNIGESWVFTTDGGGWNLFTTLGSNPTTLTGLGTSTATITGTTQLFTADYVLTTQSPKNLTFTAITNGGLEAIAIGFAVTKVKVCKNIGDRINSADQFVLDIAGNPNDQIITTGAVDGMQSPCAVVYALPGNTYTINEKMTPGSVSPLTAYTQTVSAINMSPGGSVPPTGSLPINFTPALG
ncbi:MAG: CshA/CshB family fibrillar adhesin-related protein, partial [Clostridium sp.]